MATFPADTSSSSRSSKCAKIPDSKAARAAAVALETFIADIKSYKTSSSLKLTKHVISLFQECMFGLEWETPTALYTSLKQWVREIEQACVPHAYAVVGVALHIKKICKEEMRDALGKSVPRGDESFSVMSMRTRRHSRKTRQLAIDSTFSNTEESDDGRILWENFQVTLCEAIDELRVEVDSSQDNICNQALDHIHTNEFILTMGYSRTLKKFFKNTARKRKFNLIIAEGGLENSGHLLAQKLASTPNIEITIIPDAAIFAVMSRVNKVIINCYAVGVGGSLCGRAGFHSLALAAHSHSVPLLVCCALFKLVPRFSMVSPGFGNDSDCHLPQNPNLMMDHSCAGTFYDNVTFINPSVDEVPGHLVTLYITNIGAQAPNYIYRLINDMFHENFNMRPKKLL